MYRQLTTYSKALGSILALFGMMIFSGGSCFLQKVQDKIWDATPPSLLPPPQGNSADTNKQENNTYAYSYEKTNINNQDERNDKSGYGNSDDDLETSDNESGYETTEDYIENNSHIPAPNYDGYYYSNSSPTVLFPEKENASGKDLDQQPNDQQKPNVEGKEESNNIRKQREKNDTDKSNDEDEKEDNAHVEIDKDNAKDNDEDEKDNTTSDDDNRKGNDDEEEREDEHVGAGTVGSNANITSGNNNNNPDAISNGQTKDKKKDVAGPASCSTKNDALVKH